MCVSLRMKYICLDQREREELHKIYLREKFTKAPKSIMVTNEIVKPKNNVMKHKYVSKIRNKTLDKIKVHI